MELQENSPGVLTIIKLIIVHPDPWASVPFWIFAKNREF